MSDAITETDVDRLYEIATGGTGDLAIKTIGDGFVAEPLDEAAGNFVLGNGDTVYECEFRAAALEYAAHHLHYTDTKDRERSVAALRWMAAMERKAGRLSVPFKEKP